MSQSELQEQDKNMDDKKEIADEEREKMLNAENTKHTGAAPNPDLESEDHKPKRKIPIGGIKMPGFCRSKSKEPSKEDESKPAEIDTSAAAAKDAESAAGDKAANAVKEPKDKEARKGILDAIRLPLSSVFNRKRTKEADAELGQTGGVGLASVETLEDAEAKEKAAEDGMETVRLDADGAQGVREPAKQQPLLQILMQARRNPLVTGVVMFLLCASLILLGIAAFGGRAAMPLTLLIDGRFVETQTGCGLVQGVHEEDAYVFRGIPYAVPPLGEMRWRPAKLQNTLDLCWKDKPFLAHNASEQCWQRALNGSINGQEDCLALDVYTPSLTQANPLPVVVMIGAETLSGGSPGVMLPSGKLARENAIVYVRPNFRLGVFGFLAVDAIHRATHPPTSGNYALSDIVAVLNWVQENIRFFGGDRGKVILWGHRAGGTLVSALLGSKPAQGKFQQAWISGGSSIFPTRDLQDSERINEEFMRRINCSDLACLQNKGAEQLMEAVPEAWNPRELELPEPTEKGSVESRHQWLVKDGVFLKDHIGTILRENPLPVSVVMGTTAQAGAPMSMLSINASMTELEVQKKVNESMVGQMGLAEEALKTYGSTLKGLATMISDIRVVCPLLTTARNNPTIPFYVSTFPRENLADPDSDAAAILGFFPNVTPPQTRHLAAMQKFFKHYVWHNEIKDADSAKRVMVVEEDPHHQTDYANCNFWIKNGIVPAYARVD